MAVRADLLEPVQATLGATLTRVNPGEDVSVVWMTAPADVYLVYDDALDDGAAVPATGRFRVPANVAWPLATTKRPLVAAASGTTDATFLGQDG